MRVAVTGHLNITAETAVLVREEIARRLTEIPNLVGVSCIARGADSVFAQAVLEVGGRLEVVLPSRNHREARVKPDHVPVFDELVARASEVQVMDFEEAGREAYEAANEALLGAADRLIAVWDGEGGESGGTGSVVKLARERGLAVDVVWPEGAARS
ncbi:hypothetical protein NLM24_13300 [Nocardia zapadnayensis]|uniref:hypothetical protein n=1 Tax=Nocardia rhamnosiphila TaxID=426716 RepID=UPI0022479348|nr:hypothetical protein [Nocardia zapadnayensis]MCX0271667.1 hypothetical protein [Nocardia zapadnayensis]